TRPARARDGGQGGRAARTAHPPARTRARQPLPHFPLLTPMKLPMPRLRRRRAQHVPDPVVATAIALALLLAGCASTHGLAPEGTPMDADALAVQRSMHGDAGAPFPDLAWWQDR